MLQLFNLNITARFYEKSINLINLTSYLQKEIYYTYVTIDIYIIYILFKTNITFCYLKIFKSESK